jgi:hypothetical protein
MKTIEVTVSPTGEVKLETKGYAGQGCQEASKFLEKALGEQTSDTRTPESFAQAQEQQQTKQ